MSSREFWRTPLREFLYAIDGYANSRGARKGGRAKPMTHKRLMELAEQYPDTPRVPKGEAAGLVVR